MRLIQEDVTLIERAPDALRRWDAIVDSSSRPLRDEWVRILNEKHWALALSTSERGNQLRQASPMACLLPTATRLAIIQDMAILKADPSPDVPVPPSSWSEFSG